jgi:glycosyltransferase involved in cell wall biosynthesis
VKSVLAYPGNMPHAQQIARALFERTWLTAFVTTYVYRRAGLTASLCGLLPAASAAKVKAQFERRSIEEVPDDFVHSYPLWEALRSLARRAGAGSVAVDALWDHMSRRFDALVARRYVAQAQAIHAFEYTALATFESAEKEGVARVLHLPSLSSRESEAIRRRETANWSDLANPHALYFARKFPERQARRDAEIALADVIVANSSLTARSHIAGGADPAKVVVASLGAPPTISEPRPASARGGALSVMWAGHFNLGKGAHYMLDAWRRLDAKSHAKLNVYGDIDIPERLLATAGQAVTFHGPVARSILYDAYQCADILVFPSLSDGFGMVVSEALAHGLPVITTDMAGAADLVTSHNGFVVPAADAAALADALRWCLDNRDALQDMRIEALAAARRRQWSDFRRDLITGVTAGLDRAGRQAPIEAAARIEMAGARARSR